MQYLQSVIKIQVNRSFIWSNLEVKMEKLRKIAKIKDFESKELKELLESIENKGFQVLWDDKRTGSERTWKIYKTIKTNETFVS